MKQINFMFRLGSYSKNIIYIHSKVQKHIKPKTRLSISDKGYSTYTAIFRGSLWLYWPDDFADQAIELFHLVLSADQMFD